MVGGFRKAGDSSSEEEGLLPEEARAAGWPLPAVVVGGAALAVLGLVAALSAARGAWAPGARLRVGHFGTVEVKVDASSAGGAEAVPGGDAAVHDGTVVAMYTYGAPATAQPALTNLLRKDGCFGGLRMYNEDVLGPATIEVDAAAISNMYPHAKMDLAVMHKAGDSTLVPCRRGDDPVTQWPNDNNGDVFADWRLHWENDYTPRITDVHVHGKNVSTARRWEMAYITVLMAYKAYDSTANTIEQVHLRAPSWKLVARETRIQGSGALYDEDPVALFQDSESLNCALVFTGTNNVDNEIGTSTTSFGASYCGFAQVHEGYRNELFGIAQDLWPRIRPKLSKCSKVTCAGHSLGGSLCEIFAACANSQRVSDLDYQNQMWARGTPELMPEITVGGTVYVGDAEHRCEEPPCPKR